MALDDRDRARDRLDTRRPRSHDRRQHLRPALGARQRGEYAAINSAVDELIPRHHRGVIDIAINGTYWAGAAFGAVLTV
ncbi:MAG TPA: hypothetical protein VGJ54_13355, partial [Streptosporangiaceae bacterium]